MITLEPKNIYSVDKNNYTYCKNNPICFFDPLGLVRCAVFYDNRTSGFLWGLIGGKGFQKQAKLWIRILEKQGKNVDEYPFKNIPSFVNHWNSASGSYDEIIIFAHGEAGSMDCNGTRLLCDATKPSDHPYLRASKSLKFISSKFLFLFACNGATGGENSLAALFVKKTNSMVFAVKDGKVNINYSTGMVSNKRGYWVKMYERDICVGPSSTTNTKTIIIEKLNIKNLSPYVY